MSDLVVLPAGVAAGLFALWVCLIIAFAVVRPSDLNTAAALRLVPDTIVVLRRLATDPTLPRGVRVRLLLLLAYLVSPVDLIPDVIPVIGYADDAIVIVIALRSVMHHAGPRALDTHWPGTPEGLSAVKRLAGVADDGRF